MSYVITGDCRSVLTTLQPESVNCCVTSPPYWGLRDYGHDGQIGLEQTPEAYVSELVAVFREVRRVLRGDGTVWLNLGDSYAAQRGGTQMPAETLAGGVGGKGDVSAFRGRSTATLGGRQDEANPAFRTHPVAHRNASRFGLKHKDLVGIPWRVAFALQADGWYLRSDIIWAKPNPMPESVTDRPTKAHEYVFLLTKSARYWYDAGAIADDASASSGAAAWRKIYDPAKDEKQRAMGRSPGVASSRYKDTRNARTVWTIATQPYPEAHFATFPPELARRCIRAGCPVGGTVLDPFAGSGTTGAVAIEEGREFVGIELNPSYVVLAEKRFRGAQPPLFAGGDA